MRLIPVLLLALPAALSAQGIIIPRCPRPMPMPERPVVECPTTRPQVTRTRSDVRVELRDRVLRYEVEERFVNNGGTVGEADYLFPLPKGAAFRDLKLSIDGQLVAGETMSATEARRIYEDIVRRQKDPALVEWMGHGMLRTRIFPFQAGEERRVVVRFESVADREGDALRVDYFKGSRHSAIGPRLEGERRDPSTDSRERTNFTLTYRAGGELGEPYSPTHELDTERDGAVRRVAIRAGGPDITVLVGLRRSMAASVAVLTNATRDEQGYALITVTPPSELAGTRLPRDVTLVIDASGSMSGRKMEQAKAAGRQLLGTLTERDRFRVIDFSTDVRSFRDEFVSATDTNIRSAIRYLEAIDATGSTNISGALEEALGSRQSAFGRDPGTDGREPSTEGRERVPLVIFMTDGAATVGERDPAAIAQRAARLRDNARVFSIGMGADVNISLIEQLAIEGRGTAQFVRPEENVEHFVETLASRLRAPVLTNVRVQAQGGVRFSQVYPAGPQDIFAGQDLVLLARYDGDGPTNVVVEGRSGGRDVRWSSQRNFSRDERDNAFVPRLWATQRIGWLAAEKRRNGGNSEIDDEIRRLGERFGIPTEFTSYLVLEPGMVANRNDRRQDAGNVMRLRGVSGAASGAAPAPAVAQFESAKSASEQRAAKSVAAADAAVMSETATAGQLQRAGAKLFKREGDRWLDLRMKSDLRVYKVKAYSPSYFALLEKLPELRQSFAVAEKVLVAGRAVAVEVVEDAPDLTETEVQRIIAGW